MTAHVLSVCGGVCRSETKLPQQTSKQKTGRRGSGEGGGRKEEREGESESAVAPGEKGELLI